MSKDQVTDKGAVTLDEYSLDAALGGVSKIEALAIKQKVTEDDSAASKVAGQNKYSNITIKST